MRGIKTFEAAVAIGVVLLLLILVLYFSAPEIETKSTMRNATATATVVTPGEITPLEDFLTTLAQTEELAIVENVSGLDADRARLVYQCGVGLAGSWGLAGKNISKLYIYVIDDEGCTFGSPLMNETINKSISECAAEFERLPKFYITYGASFSTFTNTTASIYIDEDWKKNCGFSIVEEIRNE